ncbi:MAG: L,D-transpeptidase [Thermoleophilia bacterium]|nr:L,D-transpeptidase [Gaiellaceae bacterium]MDW8338270.1 L,D-transpeptidase [Thermoleophilia bacterium]
MERAVGEGRRGARAPSLAGDLARRDRGSLLGAAALVALAAAALTLVGSGPADAGSLRASEVRAVGAGTLTSLRVPVYARPTRSSRRVAVLRQFRPDFRPLYVLALEVRARVDGTPAWYRITYPGRPNGQTGWVRASAVELRPVRKRLVIYRGERRFEFWVGDRLLRTGKVAVGKPGAETPSGLFYVTWKFDPTIDPEWAILGAYAFETSAYSRLTDWPGGGIVGVHGTPWPELLGQAVSHGCVRLHNRDILFLKPRVPLGTPVKIVP